jgi:crossover junction endodeoxyribonuclease RusA
VTRVLTFFQPAQRISMNDRMHWGRKSKLTTLWRHAAGNALIHSGVPFGYSPERDGIQVAEHLPPCYVRVTFPVPDNRRRDADNPAPTVKAIVDGLVDAGLWPDDTPEWVETLGSRFEKGATEVVVELIPRQEIAA